MAATVTQIATPPPVLIPIIFQNYNLNGSHKNQNVNYLNNNDHNTIFSPLSSSPLVLRRGSSKFNKKATLLNRLPPPSQGNELPLSQADLEFEDFQRGKMLATLVALIGSSGLIVPLLTAALIPFELLNPNLLLAKSLALLSLPVAVMSYGRSLEDAKDVDKDYHHHDRRKRSLVIIHRLPGTSGNASVSFSPSKVNKTHELRTTSPTTSSPPTISDQRGQQCLQRLACQSIVPRLQPIPMLVLRSSIHLMPPKLSIVRANSTESMHMSRGRARQRFKKGTSRRKNLAKYALTKIRNSGGGNKSKVKEGSVSLIDPSIPADLIGWFNPAPFPPITKATTTTTTTTPTTTTTTENPTFPTVEDSDDDTTDTTNINILRENIDVTTTRPIVNSSTAAPINHCLRYRCSFLD